MNRIACRALAAALVLSGAACSDVTNPSDAVLLDEAFNTVPAAFNNTTSSFAGGDSTAWTPGGHGGHGGHHGGRGHGGPLGGLMGGGLMGLFMGDGMGRHHGRQPFGEGVPFANCAFDASSGRNVCPVQTREGITIHRSAQFLNTAGAVQQAYDTATTHTVNARVTVAGTRTRRDGATSTVEHASSRTVSGLATGSTQRTVNGTSAGRESTRGSDSTGAFTAVRVAGDTITSVVIPEATTANPRPFPTSGTIVRSMQITVTRSGQAPVSSTRREVVTYNGSNTATLVITRDGTTRTCTLPLPHGRPTCP